MKSLRLNLMCALALAACGGSETANNDAVCGNGVVESPEQCDDGNTVGNDGCSATCRIEATAPTCGDNIITSPEECDDGNTVDGDGCSATCTDEEEPMKPETCGDGALDAGEDCDDGNTTASDGCTDCAVDAGFECTDAAPSVCTPISTATGSCTAPYTVTFTPNATNDLVGHAIGDTTGGMDNVPAHACGDVTSSGAGADHVYAFTLATATDVLIGSTDTNFNAALRLSTTPCSFTDEVIDDMNGFGCSDDSGVIQVDNELYYVRLPAGTYYLTVDGRTATDVGAYDVAIVAYADSYCGDGELDGGEECDDGDLDNADGCSDRCNIETGYICDTTVEPSVCEQPCGNGVFDLGYEECEPTADTMDVCSATCTLISDVTEVEPNNTTPQMVTAANHRIRGSLTSATDVDLYTFTLTQPAIVEFETYNAVDEDINNSDTVSLLTHVDCYYAMNSKLALFRQGVDYTVDANAIAFDDNDGDVSCSYLGPFDGDGDSFEGVLEPGTYVVRVTANNAFPVYILDMYVINSVAPAAGDLVINEVMANDATADTNCDGITTGEADEFVELVNVSDKFLTINGVRVHDSTAIRHTFAPGPTGFVGMFPGEAVVVYAGGTPSCTGVISAFTASSGGLTLGNSGDGITVHPAGTGTTMPLAAMTFTAAQGGVAGVSMNLNPDVTGTTYLRHDQVPTAVGNFSPGFAVDQNYIQLP